MLSTNQIDVDEIVCGARFADGVGEDPVEFLGCVRAGGDESVANYDPGGLRHSVHDVRRVSTDELHFLSRRHRLDLVHRRKVCFNAG